ncbi:MAG: thiamine pyrophosphate-binding protein [Deltaproteobacteria bacterium]|nr:thiamine pyrophosphate-binding protein [Deltaproteobacteria bacterium]
MAEITGGELLLKCLKKEGVKRIFGLPDFAYNTVLANVERYDIRWVVPRHEAAAVHMAEGVYKTSGEIPVVMSGAGPGTANLVSGIICAKEEGVPVIAITAQRRSGVIYPSRSGVYQGLDQYDIFRPITKWNAVAHSWERIPEIIQRAYREAMVGRPGPVQIDIPDTIFYATGDEALVKILEPHQYKALSPEPSEKQIKEMARLISEAKNPLLIAGTGVLNSEAWDDFLGLVELLNCPATTTMAARSAMPNDHPNYIFGFGRGALTARKEADVILAVGTRLGELDLPFDKYWGDIKGQKIIQVDIDPRNIGVNRPIAMGIVGDAKASIKILVGCLKNMGASPSDGKIVRKYKDIEEEWWIEETQAVRDYTGDKIHPAHSVEIARKVFPADAINVGDGGNTSLFNASYTPFSVPRTSLGIFEFGHLGTGIPYAIGAKLANPDRDVYVITGDGAAGFNFMEMVTALREKAKITVIVHAEEAWCMEEISQLVEGVDPSKVVGCAQLPIRWDKVAESLGCYGEYVEKIGELPDAIKRAKDSKLPAVVCVKTDKQSNLIPPGGEQFEEVYTGPVEG